MGYTAFKSKLMSFVTNTVSCEKEPENVYPDLDKTNGSIPTFAFSSDCRQAKQVSDDKIIVENERLRRRLGNKVTPASYPTNEDYKKPMLRVKGESSCCSVVKKLLPI